MIKKFRVWSKERKKFIKDEYLAIGLDGKLIWRRICYSLNEDDFWDDSWAEEMDKDEYVIQQWTGLTDSQGVEIYEGDILKWGEKNLSKVEFYNGAFFVFGINWGACWQLADYADAYKIVGNIFQNPELLEKS